MKTIKLLAAGVLAVSLAACQTQGGYGGGYGGGGVGPGLAIGTVGGAVAGGLLGNTIGGGSGRVVATVAGAAIGGLLGGAIGNSLDEQARQRAYAAQYNALEYGPPGRPVAWRHEGSRGSVTPGPYYSYAGQQQCREYTHTIYINGRPETARGTACRNPDGSWQPVG